MTTMNTMSTMTTMTAMSTITLITREYFWLRTIFQEGNTLADKCNKGKPL